MNPTNNPQLRSFITVEPDSHFPIQNLPYGVFRYSGNEPHIGVAIGDFILDLHESQAAGLLKHDEFREPTLNAIMALGKLAWTDARAAISKLLRDDEPTLRDNAELRERVLIPMRNAEMVMPVAVREYTDFYSSRYHATNVGTMLRGAENALQPNWLHLPVAYHGRASSIVVSGTDFHRPHGQTKADDAEAPTFGPSRAMDFELEMGFFIGPGTQLGQPIPIAKAADHIFGMCLVNDWSARDIQKWEYQPLGPFLSKSFATSISPWIMTLDALEPFRTEGPKQDPQPLPYLATSEPWAFDIRLEVYLQAKNMDKADRICVSNNKHLYWNLCQQLAHHTINGCNVCPGDLMASGTISGPDRDSRGCMLELAWRGQEPVQLSNGESRVFLLDDDCVTMTGWCQGEGYRVGFGEVTGRVLAADKNA